ncbi:MAG: tRNA (5-methylaminomethyl-2-thiouridine)(34)-methyltransferase MnmD [Caulobacter sp.]|nr:tRNA (5-methylaminomethyl-2-thiouridine)(34)-methyltransferase MnmD [Caulobacter sp.]
MTPDDPSPHDPALVWGDDGFPRSGRYDDVYFSSDDGLAESRAVFLAGCGLPDAWAGRRHFVVGELGFGTGLNIAALIALWTRTRPPSGRLHIFSIEAHPVHRDDAARALGRWPDIGAAASRLLDAWPRRTPGFHRLELADLGVTLDLAVMEVETALRQWRGRADAWFLDGFAPAANPGMWRPDVLALVADRSAPGARVATFTVAGAVRRGLAEAGFQVEKRPGFGRKRERLEAWLPGAGADPGDPPAVAVIGAGIAGAALARAFRVQGVSPLVFDARGPGGGGSGNPAALVTPRLDAGLAAHAMFHAQAFARAEDLYSQHPEAVIARGALQLETDPRDAGRFDRVAGSGLFAPGTMARLSAADASARMSEPVPGGLDMPTAPVLEPAALLSAWAGEVRRETVVDIADRDGRKALLGPGGETLCVVDVVCIAAGHRSMTFAPELSLQPVRGQASWTPGAIAQAVSRGGYAIPTRDGVLFGATFDRDNDDEAVSASDTARNLALLGEALPALAGRLSRGPHGARAAIRAATRDQSPLAGQVPDAAGLFILAGLGSRGFCTAPLLAEHVAALILGLASPLPEALEALVDPARFRRRARRRGSP